MKSLRIIGDVHGLMAPYFRICEDAEKSGTSTIQLGDLGFHTHYNRMKHHKLNAAMHKFFPGNHDDYDNLPREYCIGLFGEYTVHNWGSFFYVSGAYSIDKRIRTPGKDWWPTEELSARQMDECVQLYKQIKPSVVITHDCPMFISEKVGDPAVLRYWGIEETFVSNTQRLLNALWQIHKPRFWFFGHYHQDWVGEYSDCWFRCLNELGYYDLASHNTERYPFEFPPKNASYLK